MSFLQIVEGPLFYVAMTIFVLGVVVKLIGLLALGNKADLSAARDSGIAGGVFTLFRHFIPRRIFLRQTAYHVFSGYAFHLGLFALLLFAAPHINFLKDTFLGFGWVALPRWGFIVAAQFAFIGLLMLLIRRITNPVQRLISDRGDFIAGGLTFLVMLTGCLALQQSHIFLRAIHMLVVDIWLIYFPFSRLMHTFTFFFSRVYTGASYGKRGVEL